MGFGKGISIEIRDLITNGDKQFLLQDIFRYQNDLEW